MRYYSCFNSQTKQLIKKKELCVTFVTNLWSFFKLTNKCPREFDRVYSGQHTYNPMCPDLPPTRERTGLRGTRRCHDDPLGCRSRHDPFSLVGPSSYSVDPLPIRVLRVPRALLSPTYYYSCLKDTLCQCFCSSLLLLFGVLREVLSHKVTDHNRL